MRAFLEIYPKEYASEIFGDASVRSREMIESGAAVMLRSLALRVLQWFCIELLLYCHIGTYLKRVKVDAT